MKLKHCFCVLAALVFALLIFPGCGDEQGPAIPFSGGWGLGFDGPYQGGASVSISHDGSCSDTVELTDGHSTSRYSISFNVDSQGQVSNGRISNSGTQVGTFFGRFSGSSGNGTSRINQTSGTWFAWRN